MRTGYVSMAILMSATLSAAACDSEGDAAPAGGEDSMTQAEKNKDLVVRFGEALITGDLATLDEIVAPDYFNHTADTRQQPPGIAGVKALAESLHAALPDAEVTPELLVAEGDLVTVQYTTVGTHSGGPLFGVPAAGNRVRFKGIDIFQVTDGKIAQAWTMGDRLTLMTQITAAVPDTLPVAAMPVREVTTVAAGEFLEGVALGPEQTLYVTSTRMSPTGVAEEGRVLEVSPDGAVTTLATLPIGPSGIAGVIVFGDDGNLYVTVNHADNAEVHGVWRVSLDGGAERLAAFAPQAQINGITLGEDGLLYVADSAGGIIWQVDRATGVVEQWASSPLLAPRPVVASYPGANGVQMFGGAVYVAVSDTGLIVRILIESDGSAGPAEIYARGVPMDDFAIADDGTLYGTTHLFNSVVRIRPDGTRDVIAAAEHGAIGPTAAVLGRSESGRQTLYVVTDGGLFAYLFGLPVDYASLRPAVLALELPL